PLAAEHGINAPGQAAFLGQPEQQTECRIGYAMLRVVEIESGGFGGQTLAPAWIVGEELAQMPLAHLLVVFSQGFPRRERSQRWLRGHRWPALVDAPCSSVALFDAMQSSRSCHDLSKDAVPSRWSWVASAASSTPIRLKAASVSSASPPSTGITPRSCPRSEIGRASCRERVRIAGVAGAVKADR